MKCSMLKFRLSGWRPLTLSTDAEILDQNYKHIIWDWNGTLLDDAWLCVDIMDGMLAKRGMKRLTLERYQRLFDFPVIDYYRRLGFDFKKESFEVSGTEFINIYEKRRGEVSLKEDAVAMIERVRDMGMTQSLLSAYQQSTLEQLTADLGIQHYFERVIGLDNHYAFGKIENGKMWLEEMTHDPQEVLLIGDTVHDHVVASELNIDCLLIPSGHHSEEKLARCGSPLVQSLSHIENFIEKEVTA